MDNKYLATYLNDHLAGAVGALELIEHFKTAQAGTPLERFLTQLQVEISEDRELLEALMVRLHIRESRTRQATAWLGEKVSELKVRLGNPADEPLRHLETFEALSLGIEGKRSLWLALAEAAQNAPGLQGVEYARLIERAEAQRRQVEERRLQAARAALGTDPAG
jgi:hypothetical protein